MSEFPSAAYDAWKTTPDEDPGRDPEDEWGPADRPDEYELDELWYDDPSEAPWPWPENVDPDYGL